MWANLDVPFFFKGFGGKIKNFTLDGKIHNDLIWRIKNESICK